MSRLSVHVGSRDVTDRVDSLSYSNVDPGGHEVCQIALTDAQGIRPGERLTIREGTEIAGEYRVNEPGDGGRGARQAGTVAAVGYGARLKDNPYREIYVDQDLSHWGEAPRTRQVYLSGLTPAYVFGNFAQQVRPDAALPALASEATHLNTTAALTDLSEWWYDAQGIDIGSLYYNLATGVGANWGVYANLATDDILAAKDTSVNHGAGPATSTLSATVAGRRYGVFQVFPTVTFTGDGTWMFWWRTPVVYGRHGLAKRGTAPEGFYASDIALDALRRSGAGVTAGTVQESSGLIVPHAVYMDPTPAEQVIDDMAKLLGWHWGVWDSPGLFSTQPVLHFHPTPPRATCVVSRSELTDLDPPKIRLDALYDRARVRWKDPAGTSGYAEVAIPNPILNEAGESRTLELDLGVGSEDAAEAFGRFALLLSQRNARGGGSCTVPQTVRLPGGGVKPATLLKAGRDRIRITDLPDAGMITETDTRRLDTFRVRRVETTVDDTGVPRVRVEFDGGADLLEVLQARLQIATTLAGG